MTWKQIPYAFISALIWAWLKYTGVDTNTAASVGAGIVIAMLIVLLIEFVKSGDIDPQGFFLDQLFALLQAILCTIFVTLIYMGNIDAKMLLADWIFCAVIGADALLSPWNSFRIALRNVAPVAHHGH